MLESARLFTWKSRIGLLEMPDFASMSVWKV